MVIEETKTYQKLRTDVSSTLERGQELARKAVERVRVQTYWEVGACLNAFLETTDRVYGDQTLKRLADDIGMDHRRLYEMADFNLKINKVQTSGILTWSHFALLIRVSDNTLRMTYLEAAEANKWSVRQLTQQINDGALAALPLLTETPPQEMPRLQAKRGEPGIHRLIDKPGVGPVVDLGFRVYEDLSDHEASGLQIESLVQAEKTKRGTYSIVPYPGRRQIYSYAATIASIIDADTLWVTIHCGFGTFCDQKVRLRGIDSSELKTPAGVRARDYVVQILADVDKIVVTTTKLDLYDRYLSDIFYLPGESDVHRIAREGSYLNRELIETGHARPWTETPTEW